MILRATDVGELAAEFLAAGGEGRVTRVFRGSAYIGKGPDVFVVLGGKPRSPMTVNVEESANFERIFDVGELCLLAEGEIRLGRARIETGGGRIYRSRLGKGSEVSPIPVDTLLRGATAVRMLQDVAGEPLQVAAVRSFRDFGHVLSSASRGKPTGTYDVKSYMPLIGLGGGFTPAGDDLVGGFTAAFNHAARKKGLTEILLPMEELEGRTVPESAALLNYAQRCCVDEEVEDIILSAYQESRKEFVNALLQVANRGNTSGLYVSIGIILAVAVVVDLAGGEGAVDRCVEAIGIGKPRTL